MLKRAQSEGLLYPSGGRAYRPERCGGRSFYSDSNSCGRRCFTHDGSVIGPSPYPTYVTPASCNNMSATMEAVCNARQCNNMTATNVVLCDARPRARACSPYDDRLLRLIWTNFVAETGRSDNIKGTFVEKWRSLYQRTIAYLVNVVTITLTNRITV